jgi:tRNA1Val (adenine37-N6)-methyltransferase
MSNTSFQFKQFSIKHDKCAMKVGTDGVLLGAWTNAADASSILDVGCGTGLIAIMLAQKSEAKIEAIEIDESACLQAIENIAQSPWKSKIRLHHLSFQDFAYQSNSRYDLIVSNPPFFQEDLKSPEMKRSQARHAVSLTWLELLDGANKLLSETGRLSVVLPFDSWQEFSADALLKKLYPSKITVVKTKPGKPSKRIMAEFTRIFAPSVDSEICLRDENGNFSEEYVQLTKDYYPKLN